MNKTKTFLRDSAFVLTGLLAPVAFVAAQANVSDCDVLSGTLAGVLCNIAYLINSAIPVLIALPIVYFIWGVISYVISDSEEGKGKGRTKMIMGLIGLLVIVSIWGIVGLVKNSFDLNDIGTTVSVPCISGAGVDC